LLQAPQKEEFARWLKQVDNPAASCHLPFSQVSSHLLLTPLGKQSPARRGKDGCMLQPFALGRQGFSLAFPCEAAGAQKLWSFLITKIEPMSPWTDSAYSA